MRSQWPGKFFLHRPLTSCPKYLQTPISVPLKCNPKSEEGKVREKTVSTAPGQTACKSAMEAMVRHYDPDVYQRTRLAYVISSGWIDRSRGGQAAQCKVSAVQDLDP